MYNLAKFTYREMMTCRSEIRDLFAQNPETVEEGAQRFVRYLHDNFGDADGNRACALVRMFKTHPFDQLAPDLQDFARQIAPTAGDQSGLRCLVLLATAGDEPAWNTRQQSTGHLCIPLVSEKMVEGAPMIAQLIKQMGLKIAAVVNPDPALMLVHQHDSYNVFYVPRAKGSPYIVAQEGFVARYGIASVVGFGGLAGPGDLIATILFSRVPISAEVAELFKIIGLNARIAMLPLLRKPLFH